MKVVILAGGQQSTLSNKGEGIPKPNTVEIHKERTEDWVVMVVNTGLDATP